MNIIFFILGIISLGLFAGWLFGLVFGGKEDDSNY